MSVKVNMLRKLRVPSSHLCTTDDIRCDLLIYSFLAKVSATVVTVKMHNVTILLINI